MILNRRAAFALITLFIVSGETTAPSVSATEATTPGPQKSRDLQSLCTPEVMRRYAPRGVVIKPIPNYSAAPVVNVKRRRSTQPFAVIFTFACQVAEKLEYAVRRLQ